MNNNNSILLVDPAFDPGTALNCNLLLKITADSLSYALVNVLNNRVQVLYDRQNFLHQGDELHAAIQADAYLKLAFNSVKVCSYTINSISIPNDFYKEEQLDLYAPYFSDLENYSLNLNTTAIADTTFKTIFLFPQVIEDTLQSFWPDAAKYEQTAPFLVSPPEDQGPRLYLDFSAGSFYAMLFKDGQMIFQNFYQTENADEFGYYLLLIVKQLQLDAKQTAVYISGILNEGDPQHQLLLKYFGNVKLNAPLEVIPENCILEDMPAHYYTSLLALRLCE